MTTGLPIVAVPTTYAGSEATAVWGLTEGARKTTGTDPRVLPKVIVYDAALTVTLPVPMSVASGLNALAHCVDAMWGPNGGPDQRRARRRGHPVAARPACRRSSPTRSTSTAASTRSTRPTCPRPRSRRRVPGCTTRSATCSAASTTCRTPRRTRSCCRTCWPSTRRGLGGRAADRRGVRHEPGDRRPAGPAARTGRAARAAGLRIQRGRHPRGGRRHPARRPAEQPAPGDRRRPAPPAPRGVVRLRSEGRGLARTTTAAGRGWFARSGQSGCGTAGQPCGEHGQWRRYRVGVAAAGDLPHRAGVRGGQGERRAGALGRAARRHVVEERGREVRGEVAEQAPRRGRRRARTPRVRAATGSRRPGPYGPGRSAPIPARRPRGAAPGPRSAGRRSRPPSVAGRPPGAPRRPLSPRRAARARRTCGAPRRSAPSTRGGRARPRGGDVRDQVPSRPAGSSEGSFSALSSSVARPAWKRAVPSSTQASRRSS